MKRYKYEALSRDGVSVKGVVEAIDKNDAVIKIKESCGVVISLEETSSSDLSSKLGRGSKIKDKTLSLTCNQFSIILSAGLPIIKAVELVAGQTEDKVLKVILEEVAGDVNSGSGLAESFERRGPQLPTTFIETVRAGEESGSLEKAFSRLCEFFKRRSTIHSKVVSALTYPLFVVAVAVIVIIIIMVYAIPKFTETFAALGIDLPWATRALIAISGFFKKYIFIILVIVALAIVLIRLWEKTPTGAVKLSKFKLRLPVIGKIELMNAASQFANTLSTMIAAGLPAVRALLITGKSMSNTYMGEAVRHAVEGVETGFSIGGCIKNENVFPELLCEMTAMGEEAGSMEDTLSVIGDYYDNEVDIASTKAVTLLEPIIICILAVFVVLVLLAVYLPMFNMYGSIV